jgi:hypothetical protein
MVIIFYQGLGAVVEVIRILLRPPVDQITLGIELLLSTLVVFSPPPKGRGLPVS